MGTGRLLEMGRGKGEEIRMTQARSKLSAFDEENREEAKTR
jgi:hypothetical protein